MRRSTHGMKSVRINFIANGLSQGTRMVNTIRISDTQILIISSTAFRCQQYGMLLLEKGRITPRETACCFR